MTFRNRAMILGMILGTLLLINPVANIAHAQGGAHNNGSDQLAFSVRLTDDMQKAEAVYQQTQKKLTPQQRDYLARLDRQLAETMSPEARVLQTESYLNICLQSDSDIAGSPAKYTDAFAAWRNDMDADSLARQQDHSDLSAGADFIDPAILEEHLDVRRAVMMEVIDGVVKQNIDAGAVNCNAVKETLSAYL